MHQLTKTLTAKHLIIYIVDLYESVSSVDQQGGPQPEPKLRKLGMKNEKLYRERERMKEFLIRIYLYLYSSKEDDEKCSKTFKPYSWQRK